jgi:hypothetical protein
MLKEKSEKLAKKLGQDDFKATNGWFLDGNVGMILYSRKHMAKKIALML